MQKPILQNYYKSQHNYRFSSLEAGGELVGSSLPLKIICYSSPVHLQEHLLSTNTHLSNKRSRAFCCRNILHISLIYVAFHNSDGHFRIYCTGFLFLRDPRSYFCVLLSKLNWSPPIVDRYKDTTSSLQSTLSKNKPNCMCFPQFFNHIYLHMSRKYVSVFNEDYVLDQ